MLHMRSHIGYCRVLLWRRSDNICIVLLLAGADGVQNGHRVATKIKAILQVEPFCFALPIKQDIAFLSKFCMHCCARFAATSGVVQASKENSVLALGSQLYQCCLSTLSAQIARSVLPVRMST